jgi:hypothetical protein
MIIPQEFVKSYSKDEFKLLVNHLREVVLPEVEKTGQPFFIDVVLKHSDLIFRPKRWVGSLVETDIKNSKDNRDASIKPKSKKLPKKLEYVLRILATKSSFNYCPVGMISDCINLEAEDRGHAGTLMFCERDTKFPSTVWNKVKNIMEDYIDEQSKTTPNLIKIYSSIKDNLTKKVSEFSINEIIPSTLSNEINEKTVGIQIKVYPNRDYHVDEILGINTTEDTWITHQKAIREVTKLLRRSPKMDEMLIEEIYGLVEGNEYFLGDKEFFGRHSSVTAKAECAEEEPLWLWASSLASRTIDDLDKYRGFDCTDEKARKKQYSKAIEIFKKLKDWETEKEFILHIAESNAYTTFEATIDKVVQKLKDNKKSYTNINDLSVGKVDAALMFCLLVKDYISEFGLNKSKENVVRTATLVFQKATELLKSKDTIDGLTEAGTGASGRYENFFQPLWQLLIADRGESLGDIKTALIYNAIEYFSGTPLNPNANIVIIDRAQNSRNKFVLKTINVRDGIGLDKGHRDSQSDETKMDNFFLQFAGDNRFFSNTRMFDDTYAKEYLTDVKEYISKSDLADDEDWDEAFANTKQFVKLWKLNNK